MQIHRDIIRPVFQSSGYNTASLRGYEAAIKPYLSMEYCQFYVRRGVISITTKDLAQRCRLHGIRVAFDIY